jgi:thymidylate kinase
MKICFIGLDGSGKSTCVDFACRWLQDNHVKHKKVRAAYVLTVLAPLVSLAKKIKIKKKSAFDGDYKDYLNKLRIASNTGSTFKFYQSIVKLEFWWQIFFNITWPGWFGYALIIDRYIFDNAVTMTANTGKDFAEVDKILKTMWKRAPRPDVTIYVQTPIDVCMSRKNDIPDRLYLEVRKPLYDTLAKQYGFITISGEQPIKDMLLEIEQVLKISFQKTTCAIV